MVASPRTVLEHTTLADLASGHLAPTVDSLADDAAQPRGVRTSPSHRAPFETRLPWGPRTAAESPVAIGLGRRELEDKPTAWIPGRQILPGWYEQAPRQRRISSTA